MYIHVHTYTYICVHTYVHAYIQTLHACTAYVYMLLSMHVCMFA